MTLTQTRADDGRRRDGAVVARVPARRSSSPPAPTGDGSTATARRTASTRRPERRSSLQSRLRRHAAQRRRLRAGSDRRRAHALTITLSARVDRWRNYDGHNLETSAITGLPTADNVPSLPDRDDVVAVRALRRSITSPSRIDVWGDVGWGFRAPTLNELYRQFRVGSTLTLANPALGPERLVGGEAGVTISPVDRAHDSRRRGSTTASPTRSRTSPIRRGARRPRSPSSGRTSARPASGASRTTSSTGSVRRGGLAPRMSTTRRG